MSIYLVKEAHGEGQRISSCSKRKCKYPSFTFTFVPSLKSLAFDRTIKTELSTPFSISVRAIQKEATESFL